ncbi:MAG TPA: energy-coupling factor transporter ATPase [Candidatus Aphodomonas merdavium]|nr:energy-coupling factor transporter ATPase [Candidatus Aphodomonas merdavium]
MEEKKQRAPLISVEHCSFAYEGAEAPAVRDVSLSLQQGEFLAVLGRNGSGKSTLAKLLNALYLPTEGRVLVNGMDTADEARLWDIRQCVGMVFQNPDNQIVATMVEEDVAFGLENMGVPTEEIRPRVQEALHAVGLEAFAQSAPHMLSGGQKQRVAVAGVLAMKPRVLVLDESTAMLDPMGRRDVFSTVRRLNREEGISVVWITHFMEEAAQADRVLAMQDGAIKMEGAPRVLFSQVERLREIGLDVPAAAALAHALRQAGVDIPEGILTPEEMVEAVCRLHWNA